MSFAILAPISISAALGPRPRQSERSGKLIDYAVDTILVGRERQAGPGLEARAVQPGGQGERRRHQLTNVVSVGVPKTDSSSPGQYL
ncbi:hypothetical protein [Catellatospora paridis]|uniref:hypothetical protein n=1 Tax=Catellatospora paridis TaxID=1617086 RepID=UPI0012D41F3D|nr:hypothetical protein [Catellatospora paridis]